MVSPSKVVQFSNYQKPQEFSQPSQSDAKIDSEGDIAKISGTPGNMGLPTIPDAPPTGELGGKAKSSGPTKTKSPKAHVPAKPLVTAFSGPDGYKADCATMTPGQLHAAYPGEYQSWKDGKSRCKKKGWPWASEWESFKGFLLSMGPKPTPAHTLDRKDNAVGAYGPDLCRWADKETQNNNKSDNIKIVVALTGEVFSAQKLAKLHSVHVKTVYKWKSNHYSDLELLAGKKSKPLHALSVKLDELPAPSPAGKKSPFQKLKMPEYKYPLDDWEPIEDNEDHFNATGEKRATHCIRHRAEYDAVAEWVKIYNAGLADITELPQGTCYKVNLPPNFGKPNQSLPPKPEAVPDDTDAYDEDEDFDPADCVPSPDEYSDDDE